MKHSLAALFMVLLSHGDKTLNDPEGKSWDLAPPYFPQLHWPANHKAVAKLPAQLMTD